MQSTHITMGAADLKRINATKPVVLGEKPNKDPLEDRIMLECTLTDKSIDTSGEVKK